MYIHVKNRSILNVDRMSRIEVEIDTRPKSYGPAIWYYVKSKRVLMARYNTVKECYGILEKITNCLKTGENVCEISDGTMNYITIDVTNVDGRTETLGYAEPWMEDFLKEIYVNRHICDPYYHIAINNSSIKIAEDCTSLEESLLVVEEFKEAVRRGDSEFSFVGKVKIDLDRYHRLNRSVEDMMRAARP